MYSSNKTTDSSRSPSPNGVGSLQENNVTKRAVLSMIANNEYRCVKLFMEIEQKKWESASLYEEYFILNWMKTDYDSISATLSTNNFISGAANYTTHPFIEYFTSKKMDELRCLLDGGSANATTTAAANATTTAAANATTTAASAPAKGDDKILEALAKEVDINSPILNSVASELHYDKSIQAIMNELEFCRNILHTHFPELRKKTIKRKTGDLDEALPEREQI
jgi:hypothetical protein